MRVTFFSYLFKKKNDCDPHDLYNIQYLVHRTHCYWSCVGILLFVLTYSMCNIAFNKKKILINITLSIKT